MKTAFFLLMVIGLLPGLWLTVVLMRPQNQLDPKSFRQEGGLSVPDYEKAEVTKPVLQTRVLGIPISIAPVSSEGQRILLWSILIAAAVYLASACALLNYEIRITGPNPSAAAK
jgi:hypothetical protein